MKIEEKHVALGEKIGKVAILAGLWLWFLQFCIVAGILSSTFALITVIFILLAILAYIIKIFVDKYGSIFDMIIIFGGLLYFVLLAIGSLIGGATTGEIVLLILSILLLAGLVAELIMKKNLDDYTKFIDGFMVFIYGFSIAGAVSSGGVYGLHIVAIIIIALGLVLYCAAYYFKKKNKLKSILHL